MTQGVEVRHEGALSSIYQVRPIDARLWTSGQPSEAQLGLIAAAGFSTVINLALHDDPRYALPDEAAAVRALGMQYVHIPVQFAAPTEADLLKFFAALELHSDARTWVHCAANIRVSAFLGLYRVLRQGWEREAAFELMHGLWQADEIWSTFIASMLARQASLPPGH